MSTLYFFVLPAGAACAVTCGHVERIADDCDVRVAHEAALPAALLQPVAHRHKVDARSGVKLPFAALRSGGNVVGLLACERTGRAAAGIAAAVVGMVTNARTVPHVVHGPNHGLFQGCQAPHAVDRQHPLVHPAQHQHIGLPHPGMAGNVDAMRGGVDLEQRVAAESVVQQYLQPLGQKSAFRPPRLGGELHTRQPRRLVEHQHACVVAQPAQGVHEPERCLCRAAQTVASIDEQDVHFRPKSAGISPHSLVFHLMMTLCQACVASHRSARAIISKRRALRAVRSSLVLHLR